MSLDFEPAGALSSTGAYSASTHAYSQNGVARVDQFVLRNGLTSPLCQRMGALTDCVREMLFTGAQRIGTRGQHPQDQAQVAVPALVAADEQGSAAVRSTSV